MAILFCRHISGAKRSVWSSTDPMPAGFSAWTTLGGKHRKREPPMPRRWKASGAGKGICRPCARAPTEALAQWWGERSRAAASPGAARALIEMNSLVDIRDVLPAIRVPTLVLHRRDDRDSQVDEGATLPTASIGQPSSNSPGKITSLPSTLIRSLILSRLLSRGVSRPPPANRMLATILFVDIVDFDPQGDASGRSKVGRGPE